MRVLVLGTGEVGRRLAGTLAALGHDVWLGTRDVEATRRRTDEDEGFARWSSQHDVPLVEFADPPFPLDLVVNATAGVASLDALAQLPPRVLDGVVLLDVANALDFSGGFPPRLAIGTDDSLGEAIQRAVPTARVVKALNTVSNEVMVAPGLLDGRHELPIAGDDGDAKSLVTDLLVAFGWPREAIVDLGSLRAARAMEGYLPLWLAFMQRLGTGRFNIHLVGEGRP